MLLLITSHKFLPFLALLFLFLTEKTPMAFIVELLKLQTLSLLSFGCILCRDSIAVLVELPKAFFFELSMDSIFGLTEA
mgnify:CR=1 FL=1